MQTPVTLLPSEPYRLTVTDTLLLPPAYLSLHTPTWGKMRTFLLHAYPIHGKREMQSVK